MDTLTQTGQFIENTTCGRGGPYVFKRPAAPAQPDAERATASRHRPISRKPFDHLVQCNVLAVLNQPDNKRCVPKAILLEVAAATCDATQEDLWSACPRADIASMQHETTHTRLFRT